MAVSESANRVRELILKAIEDHVLTQDEFDEIIMAATEDGFIDAQEQVLLTELQNMIQDGSVKLDSGK
ncbi:MAG: hypothetical protein PF481_00925 [Bacteroidales bacterium]|jgi:hypothetical protein|nr:hypothetical protein [Bacteroidales bacterium]